jgi:hypothetical protein
MIKKWFESAPLSEHLKHLKALTQAGGGPNGQDQPTISIGEMVDFVKNDP